MNTNPTSKYEAWITDDPGSMTVRIVTVEATSERQAFYLATTDHCAEGEFVRGVYAVNEGAR